MKTMFCLFSFLFLILPCSIAANNEAFYFRHYTNKNGLSHNTVYCSIQDSKGFMWFGTDDGLNRFDGYTFKIYRYNSRSTSNRELLNDRIISIFEDSSGKIWICTLGGTCYYDYDEDCFYPLQFTSGKTEFFQDVEEDKQQNLWFREHNRIVKYNPGNKGIQIYHSDQYGFRSITMTHTGEGYPMFADASSLYTYLPESDKFNRIPILSDQERDEERVVIQKICQVPQIGVLIGTDKKGLKLYSSKSQKVETIIPDILVRDIVPYHINLYWIASESGVYIYDLVDKSLINLRKSLVNDYTISDNAVYSLTKDREGGMWIGSFFGGISYLPKNYTHFDYYIGGKTHSGMLGNAIREICPDKYGNIWLGTEDNGINCYAPSTGVMKNYSLHNSLSATNIHGLYAQDDQLWIGTFNKGVEVLNIPSGKVVKRYTVKDGLTSDFVLCFYTTKDGRFFVGTSQGVSLYDKKTDRFQIFEGVYGLVKHIHEDNKGTLWIVSNEGVFKCTHSSTNKKIKHFKASNPSGLQGLGSDNATSVFEDSKGRIWITTAYGFSLYNDASDTFNRITTDDGLPSNVIYRIVEDDENKFWISTANGLVKFDPETHVMQTYTHTDGLHEAQFNYSSSYKANDGTIYMGTINGMISFNPKDFKEDISFPSLYIDRIHVPGNPEKSIQKPLSGNEPYTLTLPYNTPNFTLSYIALGYTSPDAIHYAYQLVGVDKDWIDRGTNRDVTFAGLSPGKYVFKVKSTNSSGIWQLNEQVLHVVITPPFWATGWAFLVYALIIIGGTVYFYKFKKRKLLKRHKHNQELFEVEKEKELYNAKIQFFTFITHEIRTPLTLIKAPLEKIILSEDGTDTTKHYLDIINKNTQRLLDLSNQLLDYRKTESRGFRLNFVKTNMTIFLENILQLFNPVFEKEDKQVQTDIPTSSFFAYIDQDAFSKIMTNLITNAIKYSEGYIFIKLKKEEEQFVVIIQNDGYLVPEDEQEKIFNPFYRLKETENIQGSGIGLSLSRSLTDFHNGKLTYEQTENGYNQFALLLPLKQKQVYEGTSEEYLIEEEEKEIVIPKFSDKKTLLLVEDQVDMRRFIVDELKSLYTILEADNGKKAFSILETTQIDMIISDIMMPVMDGFELCNKVKADIRFSHIPFILLTAQHNLQSRLTGLNKGADAYLEKPFSLDLLLAQIENLFKNREILRGSYLEKPTAPSVILATSPLDDIFLQKLNKYLDDHLTNEALNVEMIAQEMGMSNSSLYRKVKALSNLSPVDFIRVARLKKAVQLMQQGELRISEIAFHVGFSSPAYFSTCFQKQYGKSPSEFIKEHS